MIVSLHNFEIVSLQNFEIVSLQNFEIDSRENPEIIVFIEACYDSWKFIWPDYLIASMESDRAFFVWEKIYF